MATVAIPSASKAARRKRTLRNNLSGYLFIGPWLLAFLLFTAAPMVTSLYFSFTNYDVFTAPQWAGLSNFETMFTKDGRYWKAVQATITFVFTAIPLRLIVALGLAMLLKAGRAAADSSNPTSRIRSGSPSIRSAMRSRSSTRRNSVTPVPTRPAA